MDDVERMKRDAFHSAQFVDQLQTGLIVVSALLASLGFSLATVTILNLSGLIALRTIGFQFAVALAILLWIPLTMAVVRALKVRSKGRSNPDREFLKLLERLPETSNVPFSWSRTNSSLDEVNVELKKLATGPLRQPIIAAFGLQRLNLAVPLAGIGVALAGTCVYGSAISGAGSRSILVLLLTPAVAVVTLGLVAIFKTSPPPDENPSSPSGKNPSPSSGK